VLDPHERSVGDRLKRDLDLGGVGAVEAQVPLGQPAGYADPSRGGPPIRGEPAGEVGITRQGGRHEHPAMRSHPLRARSLFQECRRRLLGAHRRRRIGGRVCDRQRHRRRGA
jgi:hypothetical protein